MKETVKNVRKWLIDNGYIKTVTFKDEKGFVFYTPEYDGNRKDKMYDCTKFQATGKVETTTYRVTKEMNKYFFSILLIFWLLPGCSSLQSSYNMVNCKYSYNSISNLTLKIEQLL